MHVLDANELFWVTSYTYDRIMEVGWKNWPDAFALYFKLMKQARIQQTNQTYSLNEFLKKWLWRWDERLKKAKDILKSLWLVDDLNVRNEKWKIMWHYIRVNYLINEEKIRTSGITYNLSTNGVSPGVDETQNRITPTSGQTDANALSTKWINALNTKEQKIQKLSENLQRLGLEQEVIDKAIEYDDVKPWTKLRDYKKIDSWVKQLREYWFNSKEWMIKVLERSIVNLYQWITPIRERELKKKEEKPNTLAYH